jgi:hypothetical protein
MPNVLGSQREQSTFSFTSIKPAPHLIYSRDYSPATGSPIAKRHTHFVVLGPKWRKDINRITKPIRIGPRIQRTDVARNAHASPHADGPSGVTSRNIRRPTANHAYHLKGWVCYVDPHTEGGYRILNTDRYRRYFRPDAQTDIGIRSGYAVAAAEKAEDRWEEKASPHTMGLARKNRACFERIRELTGIAATAMQ